MKARVFGAVAVLAVVAAITFSPNSAFAGGNKDIVDTAVKAGNFKTLAAALQAAGLVDTLKGSGPFTVFAPTDEAFAKLPAGTVETLLKPENKDKLVKILTYHVVAGDVTSKNLLEMKATKMGDFAVKSLEGDSIDVKFSGKSVMVDNATVIMADVKASNGVIHAIDSVIMPGS